MIVLRWLWFALGVCVTLRFLYFGVMTVAAGFGWSTPPEVSQVWLGLSFFGAFILSAELRVEQFEKLLGPKA